MPYHQARQVVECCALPWNVNVILFTSASVLSDAGVPSSLKHRRSSHETVSRSPTMGKSTRPDTRNGVFSVLLWESGSTRAAVGESTETSLLGAVSSDRSRLFCYRRRIRLGVAASGGRGR